MGPELWYSINGVESHVTFPETADPFRIIERVRQRFHPGVALETQEQPKQKPAAAEAVVEERRTTQKPKEPPIGLVRDLFS